MTPRARWLAAIDMRPVDRLPFWPKLDAAFLRAREGAFKDMSLDAMHDWIGSDKHTWIGGCVKERRTRTSQDVITAGDTMQTIYRTRHGEMEGTQKFDPASQSWHPMTFPVRSPQDLQAMTEGYEDITVELDEDALSHACNLCESIGESTLTAEGIGESPLMTWVEWLAGVEMAHLLLVDHRDEVERLFDAMHRVLAEKTRLIAAHSPADVFYLIENTSTTLVSPDQYRRYCAPHVGQYVRIVRDNGRIVFLHMCGHLRALLPDLARTKAHAFEAFTSPTVGNTTLLDGRTHCPETCLIGGTNATLWTGSADEVIRQLENDLEELPHHRGVVVTSAGVMPPMCRPETIREVCEWVHAYPARMDASCSA